MLHSTFISAPPSSGIAPLFLAAALVLGILFGTVTHRTRGIGWACCVHTALDVLVEWGQFVMIIRRDGT